MQHEDEGMAMQTLQKQSSGPSSESKIGVKIVTP